MMVRIDKSEYQYWISQIHNCSEVHTEFEDGFVNHCVGSVCILSKEEKYKGIYIYCKNTDYIGEM